MRKDTMREYIKELIESSRNVFLDCSLENGAIVAANTDKEYYPKNVNNYRFVWPRDVSYILYAADILEIPVIKESFSLWLLNRAEDFKESGMLFHRYATNGARDILLGYQFQPDQAGSLLWSLLSSSSDLSKETEEVVNLLADGLCKNWNGKSFSLKTYDLWEGISTDPKMEWNFIYTLAACSHGLSVAFEKYKNPRWKEVSDEIKKIIESQDGDCYYRKIGNNTDAQIDASVLALAWPFSEVADIKKLKKSIELIEDKLLTKEGVHRYENDKDDGMVDDAERLLGGAGGWPLLTYWYIIALSKISEEDKAKKMFDSYTKNFKNYIPEQIFDNQNQKSVSPLAWSHAMFVIAAKELGYIGT